MKEDGNEMSVLSPYLWGRWVQATGYRSRGVSLSLGSY
jgi:hypothetical protein